MCDKKKNAQDDSDKKFHFDSWALAIGIILVLPLPFALFYSGIDWILYDGAEGKKEFIASYIAILVFILGSIVTFFIKEWWQGHKST
ncbi:MAG: hypothetical protein J6M18_04375 [Actinomycetaceae bacterium]|nr:hypothetical protein [Actinomycetaceae bacterium]